MTGYRSDIDGLRAVAVIPVILFHAGFDAFAGGYVGVDVFFVISGYLITGIIWSDIRAGKFSIVTFYERRVRRILPALLFVSACSIPFAWAWMLPAEFEDFAQSLVAVNLFASNILFWRETGYFEAAIELKPLLHTWSLAVEEQFYVVFPALLLVLARFRYALVIAVIGLLIVVSLALAEWASGAHPVANFYLLPTRMWELGLGALLTLTHRDAAPAPPGLAQALSVAGLIMIAVAVFAFDEAVPFPGLYALLPVAGTALVIGWSRPGTLAFRLLSFAPVAFVGLISYSAYLWHQPLFAFARIRLPYDHSPVLFLFLSAVALALAFLSWKFIEQPFRNRALLTRKTVFAVAAAASVAIAAFGVAGHISAGFPSRHDDLRFAERLDAQSRPNFGLGKACDGDFTPAECRTSDAPEIALWGDSYAMQLVGGIIASKADAGLIQMTRSFCGPLAGVAPVRQPLFSIGGAERCLAFNKAVRERIAESGSIRYAVIASNFDNVLGGGRFVWHDGRIMPADPDLAWRELKATLRWLEDRGITPVVFAPMPRNGIDIGLCLARAEWIGFDADRCAIGLADSRLRNGQADAFLARVGREYPVVRLADFLCDGRACRVRAGGVSLYRDAGHLSYGGSERLGQLMDFHGLITGQH